MNNKNIGKAKNDFCGSALVSGFNVDPDPAFYLNADPDLGSQTNADPDPDPGTILKVTKS